MCSVLKTSLFILLFSSNLIGFLHAQSTFQKAFGNVNGGRLNSVTLLDDGNLAYAGWIDVQTLFTAEFYLMVADTEGDTLWTRTYGARVDSTVNRLNGSGNEGFFATQTSDGGFIFSGERHEEVGGTSDVFIVKTNNTGELEWSKTYGELENEYGFTVRELEDGSYVVAGFTESYGAGARDCYLMKLDIAGDTLWTKTFGGTSLDLINDMLLTEDGGFILAGYTFSFGAGGSDACLIKTDSEGNIEWQYAYGGPDNDLVHGITRTSDGAYMLVGETESFGSAGSDLFIIKADSFGQEIWSRTLGGELSEFGDAIIETQSGEFVIAGSTESFGAAGIDGYLVKVDSEGQLIWSHNYGGDFEDNLNDVVELSDGSLIACGDTRSFGAGNLDAYVIKTDALGRSVCNQEQSDYFSISVNTITTPMDTEISTGSFLKRLTTLTGFTNTTQTDICEGMVSIENLDDHIDTNINVYPNPAVDHIHFWLPDNLMINTIECFTLSGEKILELYGPQRNQNIDIKELSSGVYTLKINTNKGVVFTKFVKFQ